MNNEKSAEDNKRLNAYLDFMLTDESNSIDGDYVGKSSNSDDKYEIFNRAFKKTEDDAANKSLYKSIKVDIKELSPIKYMLLTKGRQKAHDKNLKQEDYLATTEKRADDEMSGTKVEKLSFKDVWEDLIHTKSTKEFCKFLTNNPDLERPKHLVDVGFFNNGQNTTRKKKRKPAAAHVKTTRF